MIDPTTPQFAKFMATLAEQLRAARLWPLSDLPKITAPFAQSLAENPRNVSLQGPAMRATCRALGIKCTYKAITAYLLGQVQVMPTLNYQGGLSDEVFQHPEVQAYIANAQDNLTRFGSPLVFGYLGASNRTIERDRLVETELHRRGKTLTFQKALWLISSAGRHFMGDVTPRTTNQQFLKRLRAYI